MCIFNVVLSSYLRGLMDDRAGVLYYFEIIILILVTAFLYDCNIQYQRSRCLGSEKTCTHCHYFIELSYLCPSNMLVFLHSVSLRCVDFKIPDNLEILVILPLWQMFIMHEGEKVSSKNVAGVQRWIVLWMKDLLG